MFRIYPSTHNALTEIYNTNSGNNLSNNTGPTGPEGQQGPQGPNNGYTGSTGPTGFIGTSFLSERFTTMIGPNPTLNTMVTYGDTLQYGNGTLPSQQNTDGQYKIITMSNNTTINNGTEYIDTNLYDKLQTKSFPRISSDTMVFPS